VLGPQRSARIEALVDALVLDAAALPTLVEELLTTARPVTTT
jgi:hypothetical protein